MNRLARIVAMETAFMALLSFAVSVDPEPFPHHPPLALSAIATEPDPFPWQAADRIKVGYPWLRPAPEA